MGLRWVSIQSWGGFRFGSACKYCKIGIGECLILGDGGWFIWGS